MRRRNGYFCSGSRCADLGASQVAASARKGTAEGSDGEEEEEWRRRRGAWRGGRGEGRSVGLRQGAGRKGRWEREAHAALRARAGWASGASGGAGAGAAWCDYARLRLARLGCSIDAAAMLWWRLLGRAGGCGGALPFPAVVWSFLGFTSSGALLVYVPGVGTCVLCFALRCGHVNCV